ncbi:MAG: hypothetical protein JWP37_366 [Mucilaginibacter sp.]|nr:hypothetical protein [Mucilaginibacter sp.]
MSITVILVYVSIASGFLPLMAALYNYNQLDPILKLVALFCLVSAFFDLLEMILSWLQVHNNYPLLHLYDLLTILFFTAIYYQAFYESIFKKIALILGAAGLIAIICNAILMERIWTYPSISNTILSILLIILSLTYFYQLLTRQEFVHIDKQGLFWVNTGVLFYFSINIFLFMLYNKISENVRNDFYMIQSVTNIIANLLYSVGLLCKPQKTTSSLY